MRYIIQKYSATKLYKFVNGLSPKLVSDCFKLNNMTVYNTGNRKKTLSSDPEYIYKEHPREYWWNISIKTATKIPHNKPDLVIWNKETKLCSIIEFSCPLDTNIGRKVNEKLETYGCLVQNLQILYPDYKCAVGYFLCRRLFSFLFNFILFMVCSSGSLNLLGQNLWPYYSCCDKLPDGSGRWLFAVGDFQSNFNRDADLLLSYLANQS